MLVKKKNFVSPSKNGDMKENEKKESQLESF